MVTGLNVMIFCLGVWYETRITSVERRVSVFMDLNAFHISMGSLSELVWTGMVWTIVRREPSY